MFKPGDAVLARMPEGMDWCASTFGSGAWTFVRLNGSEFVSTRDDKNVAMGLLAAQMKAKDWARARSKASW
jgi:hypothetical protein